eukprot:COSAG01_NODE_797_length_13523_cov_34.143027_7_plen_71_part_00
MMGVTAAATAVRCGCIRRQVGQSIRERGGKGKGRSGPPRGPQNVINVRALHVGKIIGKGGSTIKVSAPLM